MESIVGAVFIDCKMDLEKVWGVYTKLFSIEEINKVIKKNPKHPVAELMEEFPSNVKFNPANVEKDGTVSIIVEITIKNDGSKEKFKGLGKNGTSAKYAAAHCALREMEKRREKKEIEKKYVTYKSFMINL